ncbi:hypothetical protein Hypma_000128 [Hypsizygus marmoreus]|uniref:Uncharacterized protein n=1 Tax=Hypsizygus marmoreus TaxID=39966 RepID=A0A369KAN7_HYPMA|nr:hypothetical protein Hypma_000128 [Hypsizygus marmoreus]
MAGIPLVEASMLAGIVEAVLYGFYTCIFCVTIYVQVTTAKTTSSHGKIMFFIGTVMFFLATLHLAINLYRTVEGYVGHSATKGGPIAFLGPLKNWHQVLKDIVYVTISILGDAVAVYRCWIIWNRNHILMVVPFLLLIASAVSGYIVVALLYHTQPTSIFNPNLVGWICSFYAVAIVQNTLTTGLMMYRLWATAKSAANYRVGRGHFIPIMRILMESAVLYLVFEVVILAVYVSNSNAQSIIHDSIPPIIGMTFSLITIRIAMRSRQDYRSTLVNSGTGASTDPNRTIGSIPMRRVVHIDKEQIDDRSLGNDNDKEYKRNVV